MERFIGFPPKLREFLESIGLNGDGYDFIHLNQIPEFTCEEIACMAYDNTDKTLKIKLTNNVTMQVGQEIFYRCLNKTGSTILNGSIVYVNGSQGNRPTIALANNSNYSNTIKTLGMVTEDILNNEQGFVTTFGLVRGLNTKDILEGTSIYVGNISGQYTTTKPTPPTACIRLGSVMKEHVSDGIIAIRITYEKNEFGDIDNNTYAYFNSLGFLKMIGTVVYNDLPPNPIIRSRQPATNNPTLATFKNNIQQYTFAVNDYVSDNLELMHEYKEGTNFYFHVHWTNNIADTTDRYVKWEVEYSIIYAGLTFPDTTIVSEEILIPANTTDRTHFVSNIGNAIVGTNLKIGSIIVYNIKRIASTGLAPTNNPFALQVSCHIQQDTLGSSQEYIK